MAFSFSRSPRAQARRDVDPRLEEAAAALLETRRGRPTAKAAPRAGGAVASLVKPLIPKGPATLNDLKRLWPEIVGERLCNLTEPEKLTRGALLIRCHASAAPILERIALAGGEADSIQIKQAPLAARAGNVRPLARPLDPAEEAALAAALSPIQHDGLKAALMRLGRAMSAG
jgi:hypothetical protein